MSNMSNFWLFVSLVVVAMLVVGATRGEPMPVPKVGQCPGGYSSSASYCNPMGRTAPQAMPKIGQCPSGWQSFASYCVKMERQP